MKSLNEKFQEVDLLQYVTSNFACDKVSNIGVGMIRVNPAPCCNHKDCFTIYENKKYHCFSGACGSNGTIADLMVATGKASGIKDAADKLGLNNDYDASKALPLKNDSASATISTPSRKDAIDKIMAKNTENIAKNKLYFFSRGLTPAIIAKYGLKIEGNNAILPGGIKRVLDYNPDDKSSKKYIIPAGQKTPMFNLERLQSKKLVFVCEGIIDALSVEVVGQKAISINSANNINQFLEQLKESHVTCKIVSAFDNDEAGAKATEKLKQGCKDLKIPFDTFSINTKYKDLNEWLVCDIKEFEIAITKFSISTNAIDNSLADCFDSIMEELETSPDYISTGFNELDRVLGGGLLADLYLLGGTPASGKTAFALQICKAISKASIPVLYFSLELSRKEIFARTSSILTYLRDNNSFLTTSAIKAKMNDFKREKLNNIKGEYLETFNNLHVHTFGRDRTVSHIVETAEWQKTVTGKSPVVVVDYLQLLQPAKDRQTEKQNIDNAITELKLLSNSLNMPVIIISSLSRAGYDKGDSIASYKESGSIEYSASVAMNIMPSDIGKEQLAKRNEDEVFIPCIETEVQIVKNRDGNIGMVTFDFYGAGNYFKEQNPLRKAINKNC